jgi:hypothetical protein
LISKRKNFAFEKQRERKISKEKELKKHLSIANKRSITGDIEK